MENIKKKLLLFAQKNRRSYLDYRVTVSAVIVTTLYGVICFLLDYIHISAESSIQQFLNYETNVFKFLLLFISAVMFTESLFSYEIKERPTKKIRSFCFILSAVIAAVFAVLPAMSDISGVAMRYYNACTLLLLLGSVYFCHRKSGVGFVEYIMHVCVNLCVTTAIYFVLYVGATLLLWVLQLLFLNKAYYLSGCGLILVTGLYYVPGCIVALRNMDSNVDDDISKVLIKYVLSGMTVCGMVLVYAYLFKILIMWEMPSNEIFGIVSGLFLIGMMIWIIDYFYRDDTKYMLFLQRLPYGMIPLIPVQAYAMCVRIYHHGMTPDRYMGMLLIAFEIIMLLIWRFWKEKMERAVIVLCILVVVAVFVPVINMYSMSNRWQKAILTSYYDQVVSQGEITQEEFKRLEGAFKYLQQQPDMKAVVEEFDIYDTDFAQLLEDSKIDIEESTDLQYHYVHCCEMVGTLEIDGYSRFDMVNQDPLYRASDDNKQSVDISAFRFYKRGSGEEEMFEVDLSDFAEKCLAYEKEYPNATKEEFSEALRAYQKIEISEDKVLYLNHFEVKYRDGIKEGDEYFEWTMVNVSGILLEKTSN